VTAVSKTATTSTTTKEPVNLILSTACGIPLHPLASTNASLSVMILFFAILKAVFVFGEMDLAVETARPCSVLPQVLSVVSTRNATLTFLETAWMLAMSSPPLNLVVKRFLKETIASGSMVHASKTALLALTCSPALVMATVTTSVSLSVASNVVKLSETMLGVVCRNQPLVNGATTPTAVASAPTSLTVVKSSASAKVTAVGPAFNASTRAKNITMFITVLVRLIVNGFEIPTAATLALFSTTTKWAVNACTLVEVTTAGGNPSRRNAAATAQHSQHLNPVKQMKGPLLPIAAALGTGVT
jgi:hypothetical protein